MNSSTASPRPQEQAGFWGKVFAFTPVIMTIIATTLAGISSGELTESMSWRSLAAQNQSKAGDQWSFFQVKRVRGTTLESTVELMQALGSVEALNRKDLGALNAKLDRLVGGLAATKVEELGLSKNLEGFHEAAARLTKLLDDPARQPHLETLFGGSFPKMEMRQLSTDDPKLQSEVAETAAVIEEVCKEIKQRKTEHQTASLVARIKPEYVERMTQIAEQDADNFDKLCEPLTETVAEVRKITNDMVKSLKGVVANWSELGDPGRPSLKPHFDQFNLGMRMAMTDFNARRYREESKLNQRVAEMYEVRVRRSGVESDRHRKRSEFFFYAMIAAQAGVTISSLALARTRKSFLWLIATVAGLASIGFAGWVYLTQ